MPSAEQPYGQQPYGQQPYYGGGFPPPPPPGTPYYGYGYSGAPGGAPLASMGRRFGGLVLDWLLIAIPVVLIGAATGAYKTTRTCTVDECTKGVNFTANLPVDLAALVIGMAYSAYFVGMRCQTLGHRATGIKVVDATTGGPIGAGRGALRWLVMGVTGALCTIGYWSPFFDSQRRQGWHDKATKAIAITAPPRLR